MSDYAESAAFTLEHEERASIILALHGLTGTRAQPLGYLAGLDSEDIGVLAPDLRAHGDTPFIGRPEDFSPGQLAADVTDLVARLGLASKRMIVLGVSLGATVALELVRLAELPIVAAVFVRPAHGAALPRHLEINAALASYLVDDPSSAVSKLLASDEYIRVAAASASAASSLRAKATKPGSAERAMRLRAGSRWTAFGTDETLATAPPSLIVAARNDPLHPLAIAEEWHARMSGSRIVVVPPRDEDETRYWDLVRSSIREFVLENEAGKATVP